MKDKEKQIEEMANCKNCVHQKMCIDKISCGVLTADKDGYLKLKCNYYQPKIPKDSVVLSKEEYEKLKSLYDNQKGAYMTSSIGDLPLTLEGLRKAVDEITRLNRVETELQELNAKYYNEAKDLRRKYQNLQAHAKINDEHLHIRIKEQANKETAKKVLKFFANTFPKEKGISSSHVKIHRAIEEISKELKIELKE